MKKLLTPGSFKRKLVIRKPERQKNNAIPKRPAASLRLHAFGPNGRR
jgi:hypothetical protein